VEDLTAFLLGRWQLERVNRDLGSGVSGTFTGFVTFTPDGDRIRQHESGLMSWGSYTGPASRDYLMHPSNSPSRLDVHFSDGREFHSLDLSDGCWTAEHGCSPDLYVGTFTALGPNRLEYSWRVTGPSKDLLLSTVLTRDSV
jgi:hypothetical protein